MYCVILRVLSVRLCIPVCNTIVVETGRWDDLVMLVRCCDGEIMNALGVTWGVYSGRLLLIRRLCFWSASCARGATCSRSRYIYIHMLGKKENIKKG